MPADRVPTARFAAIWTASLLPLAFVNLLLPRLFPASPRVLGAVGLRLLFPFLVALAAGAVQARLLARYRRPVPRWILATALGVLAGLLLNLGSASRAPAWATQIPGAWSALWASTSALCLATAQGLALWGRTWSPAWVLWICGSLGVRVTASVVFTLAYRSFLAGGPTPLWIALGLVQASVVAFATAWLLDLLAFRPGEPDA